MKTLRLFVLSIFFVNHIIAAPLPIKAFVKDAVFESVKLSPNGKHFAASIVENKVATLAIMSVKSKKLIHAMKFQEKEELSSFYWLNNERIVFTKLEYDKDQEQAKSYGEVYAINFDGTKYLPIFGFRILHENRFKRTKSIQPIRAWGRISSLLREDEKHLIISSTSWDNSFDEGTSLWRVNAYTAARTRITLSPFGNMTFILDLQGNPVFAHGKNFRGKQKNFLYEKNSKKKKKWIELDIEHDLAGYKPVSLSKDQKVLTISSDTKGKTDAIFNYNLDTKKIEKIFQDDLVDFYSVLHEPNSNEIVAVKTMPGKVQTHYINKNLPYSKLHRTLTKSFPDDSITITSFTKDSKKAIFLAMSDKNAGDFFLFNIETMSADYLVSRKEWIDPNVMVERKPITYKSRDGVDIHGYLSTPANGQDIAFPMVVLVHGGPYGIRDEWYYDNEAQMLANNGFAVLQVNYRGSGGYGLDFQQSAYQTAVYLTQQDIIDGTKWAQNLVSINKDKVCIMGTSFGGYSALMAPLTEPGIYKCSISMAGYYDAKALIMDDLFNTSGSIEKRIIELFGDEEEELIKASPLTYIEKLTIPVFIAHGGKDRRVPPEQAEMLKQALDDNNKTYEWMFKEKEAHGFVNEKNKEEYYVKVIQFLTKHLKAD